MSKPPKFTTTFFKNLRSILVGHFGLQSVSYRVETPCILFENRGDLFPWSKQPSNFERAVKLSPAR